MNGEVIIELLAVQVVLIVLLFLVLLYVIKARHNISLDKKFSKYTVEPLVNRQTSISDKILIILNNLVNRVSNLISKSKILSDYGKSYEKHITYDQLEKRNGIDYISIKLLLGIFTSLLYLITEMFQYVRISFIGIIIAFLIGFFVIDIFIQIEYRKKRKQISDDLLKAIIIMNNAFKSGMSIMQAIEIVKNELDGAIGDEFKKIHLDLSYGLTIEVVFSRFYERVHLEDVKFITTSLTLLNKTGGNIVKVFKSIEREFFDKKKLNDELKTVTASSTFVYRFLLFIPFAICFLVFILNPEYFNPLFKTHIGILILFLIVLLYILYVLIVKKIMKVNAYE